MRSLSASPAEDEPKDHIDSPDPNPPRDLTGGSQGGYDRIYSGPLKENNNSILNRFTRDDYPTLRNDPLIDTDQNEFQPDPARETDVIPAPLHRNGLRRSDAEPIEEMHPRKIMLEPVSAAVYNLDYACLLVPRFPSHHLTGDLLEQLGEWVPHICIAFAWRLEYISVRPEYLQWIVSVPPATSPGYLMRIVRQHTSEKIFEDFPRFKNDNPSGDFWAPGYLIMGGSQPAPAQMIKDFIIQTRQRQGISLQYRY